MTERLAFLLPYPDDRVRVSIDTDFFADGIGATNQVFQDIVPNHDDLSGRVFIGVGDVAPIYDVKVIDSTHRRRPATNLRVGAGFLRELHNSVELIQRGANHLAFRAL